MTDKELKEKLMNEMIKDFIDFYGFAVKHSEEYEPICDHLIRKGWRKNE